MNLSTSGRSGRRTGDTSVGPSTPLDSGRSGERTPARSAWREYVQPGIRRNVVLFTAMLALCSLMVVGNIPGPAYATDYPTWADVEAAKGNVDKTNAQITNIQSIISTLASEVEVAQALADKRGSEYQEAQQAFDMADRRANDIEQKAKESSASAEEATLQAGRLAAQLYRSGGNDLSVNLLFEGTGDNADQLLSKLGSMSKMVQRSSTVYEQAQVAKNTAEALGDQAKVARTEREKLRVDAEAKLKQAVAAQQAVESALAEKQAKSIELDQQLQALRDTATKTVAGYKAGVAERERIKKAQEKAAREKAAAATAAAEKRDEEAGNSSGGGGRLSDSGWALPSGGRITDNYGYRDTICAPGGCSGGFHRGTDLGASCGSGIYAAHDGTVIYAGGNGTYGNFVLIDHGNGVSTGYAHIVDGGIAVGWGQRVAAGQRIASVGMTGAADGCHLHFEVRIDGSGINAVPFMAARGVYLG